MRLLDPATNNTNAAQASKERAKVARDQAARKIAGFCVNDVVANMLSNDLVLATDHLTKIFCECVELAGKLLVQKMSFGIWGLEKLPSKYDSKSGHLQPHKLHARELDDDSKALDGKLVTLLVSPAVVVSGTTAGTGYDKPRVWKKAVVLIG
jgi:hypothetical protein